MPFLLPGSIFIFQIHSMKPTLLLAAFALFLFSCNKKEALEPSKPFVPSEREFALIPTKDAKWYVKIIGSEYYDFFYPSSGSMHLQGMDDLLEINYEISTTGKDTIINDVICHVYQVFESRNRLDSRSFDKRTYRYYLHEDTVNKVVRFPSGDIAIDFRDSTNMGEKKPFFTWREQNIIPKDSLIVSGQYLKRWVMQNTYDKNMQYFYKAIGIGSMYGILYEHLFTNGLAQVVSLDFVYKRDSLHFEYPLH